MARAVDADPTRPSVAEMRRIALCLAILIGLGGCASPGEGEVRVDVMFRKTGAPESGVVEITSPALVNELNGAFTIESAGWYTGASLDEQGKIKRGDNRVFLLEFMDRGDISLLRTDDQRVSLRAELGPDGKVRTALLGSLTGTVVSGYTASRNDTFESGTWELLYDGPDMVVGRVDLQFRKYRVQGNFRAPRVR